MKYSTVCSGIEAPSVAAEPLGWVPVWFSEIEPFPCKVLSHHYPDVPNLGDMTKITKERIDELGPVDVFVGGTPCQSFSVAGLRQGLADPRGNLALDFLRIVDALQPRWVVWENVPGVLSSNKGRDFESFLTALAELGYGWAYRVLDAQYFGVAQRRRRVFVVGHSGGCWQRPAQVLLERESMLGNPPPSREAGEGFTHDAANCLRASGVGTERTGDTRGQDPVVAFAQNQVGEVRAGQVTNTLNTNSNASGRNTPMVCVSSGQANAEVRTDGGATTLTTLHEAPIVCGVDQYNATTTGDKSASLGTNCGMSTGRNQVMVSAGFKRGNSSQSRTIGYEKEKSPTLTGSNSGTQVPPGVVSGLTVRRLTPRECERLQGFPDDYTLIPGAKDTPRYKALGNSMAVPVMRHIFERIQEVDQ